ncbi:hypothetical protein [Sphingopyxis kveilinensis]
MEHNAALGCCSGLPLYFTLLRLIERRLPKGEKGVLESGNANVPR